MMPKAAWDPEYHRVFVDLCVQEKVLGNKPGTQNILEPFQQRTGSRFKKSQLKNHWDTMIKQWKIWRRLVQSTAMKWDPVTNKFGASDQDWAEYLQLNPDAAPFRLEPPLFLKKLELIFEGSNLDDEGASGSQRKLRIEYIDEENDTGDEDRQSASNNFLTAHTKGYWSPSTHELFVDLLVEETRKGNRPDTHYPKESWRIMLETINKNSGRTYTRAQLKNNWDCTRKGWKIWCQLIARELANNIIPNHHSYMTQLHYQHSTQTSHSQGLNLDMIMTMMKSLLGLTVLVLQSLGYKMLKLQFQHVTEICQ